VGPQRGLGAAYPALLDNRCARDATSARHEAQRICRCTNQFVLMTLFVMNLKHKRALVTCLALSVTLCGCVPLPTIDGSPGIRGRVIDSATKMPIQNATISRHGLPSNQARTSREGYYRVRGHRYLNIVLAGGICGSEIPFGKYYGTEFDVSHPLYQSLQIKVENYRDPPSTRHGWLELRDIELVSTGTASAPRAEPHGAGTKPP
jgi:hypothetical protein